MLRRLLRALVKTTARAAFSSISSARGWRGVLHCESEKGLRMCFSGVGGGQRRRVVCDGWAGRFRYDWARALGYKPARILLVLLLLILLLLLLLFLFLFLFVFLFLL